MGVGEGASHERDLPRAGDGEADHELRLASRMPGVFLAVDAGSDTGRHVALSPKLLCAWRYRVELRGGRRVAKGLAVGLGGESV